MNLGELLEHTAKDYLDDRTELLDGDPDSLWSDEVLVRYLNEAQRILARRSWVLIDVSHPQAGVITLATAKVLYPLHKSVLRVYDATPDGQDTPLARYTDIALRNPLPFAVDWFDPNAVTTAAPGPPLAMATDAGTRMMRIYPPPATAQNGLRVFLKVARMPVCFLEVGKTSESPEVPEEWHLSLAKYAAARCLLHPNVDSAAKADGRALMAEWLQDVHDARQERVRAEMAPGVWAVNTATALLR